MVVYFWSRPNYGSNGNPILIYFPHSECSFKEVLDCIMLAFHHIEIPELIDIMIQFNDDEARSFEEFEDGKIYHKFKENAMKKRPIIKRRLLMEMFDIIRDGKKANKHNQHVQVAELISWAKDYAENILEQF